MSPDAEQTGTYQLRAELLAIESVEGNVLDVEQNVPFVAMEETMGSLLIATPDEPQVMTDGGVDQPGMARSPVRVYDLYSGPGGVGKALDELDKGDRVEFRTSRSEGEPSAVVTEVLMDPPFPPEADEPIPGSLTLALEKRDTGTVWNFTQEIDPADGDLTGGIEVSVKACIDVRHPPRYRWRDQGVLEACQVVATEEVQHV